MGIRNDIVKDTIQYFIDNGDFRPSTTDIRLISNDIGDSYVDQGILSRPQWEMISQDKTVKLVRSGLEKAR